MVFDKKTANCEFVSATDRIVVSLSCVSANEQNMTGFTHQQNPVWNRPRKQECACVDCKVHLVASSDPAGQSSQSERTSWKTTPHFRSTALYFCCLYGKQLPICTDVTPKWKQGNAVSNSGNQINTRKSRDENEEDWVHILTTSSGIHVLTTSGHDTNRERVNYLFSR